mmetsp:Transcript_9254/g.24599  ORF Transcript_9254/g.24599 Transcript_9254/m.24599 type:complete len:309 (-) Transcript_9254:88-1014(-)
MDHQELHPQEHRAPFVQRLAPWSADGSPNTPQMSQHVDHLAETERMPLRLLEALIDCFPVRVADGGVVHHRQEDWGHPQPAGGGEEALQGHVPVLRDEVPVPAAHPLSEHRRERVGGVGHARGVGVGQVRELVLAGDQRGELHQRGLVAIVLEMQDGGLPYCEMPVRGLTVGVGASVAEVVGQRGEVLPVKIAVGVGDRHYDVSDVVPLLVYVARFLNQTVEGPLRVGGFAPLLTLYDWVEGGEHVEEVVLKDAFQLLCFLLYFVEVRQVWFLRPTRPLWPIDPRRLLVQALALLHAWHENDLRLCDA